MRGGRHGGVGARAFGAVLAAALAAASALGTGPARAQSPSGSLGSGVEYQYLDFTSPEAAGLTSVSLLTVPVAGRATVAGDLTLEIGTTWARGEAERTDGNASTLRGFTDTNVSLSYTFGRDVLTLSAVGRLPTGQTEYTSRELDAAGVFASDLFPFRVSNWGAGGAVGLEATSVATLGELSTALTVGYVRSGEFDPVRGRVTAYQPGDNLSVRAAMGLPTGDGGQFDLQLGFQWFDDDQLADDNVFAAGNRYEAVARYTFPVGRRSAASLYGGYQRRQEGVRLDLAGTTADQDLFLAGSAFRLRLGQQVVLRPEADARLVRRGDDATEGYDLRFGGRLEWTTGGLVIGPMVRGHVGNVTVGRGDRDRESGFRGFDVGLNVRLGGGTP